MSEGVVSHIAPAASDGDAPTAGMDREIAPATGDGDAPPSPAASIARVVRDYFRLAETPEAVADPWSRIVDGLLVQVHVRRWRGTVTLQAEDFGMRPEEYAVVRERVRWGGINLLPDSGRMLLAIESRLRALPQRWGVEVHWGLFVPTSAWGAFLDDWNKWHAKWTACLDDWTARYDEAYDQAMRTARAFAAASAEHAIRIGALDAAASDAWRDRLVQRIMAHYPARDEVRTRCEARYTTAFIPSPSMDAVERQRLEALQAEHQQRLAAIRRAAELAKLEDEAKRLELERSIDRLSLQIAERDRILREETARMQEEARMRANALLERFESDFALRIRERLAHSLALVSEGLRSGRLTPMATRSLRTTIETLRRIALADDEEIVTILNRLDAAMEERTSRRARRNGAAAISDDDLRRQIDDIGLLLDLSIIGLGGRPRQGASLAIAGGADLDHIAQRARAAQKRLRISQSLAVHLVDSMRAMGARTLPEPIAEAGAAAADDGAAARQAAPRQARRRI